MCYRRLSADNGTGIRGRSMIFLTEEQVRERCAATGEVRLAPGERLTPAAGEFLRGNNCRVVEEGCPCGGDSGAAATSECRAESPAAAPVAASTSAAPVEGEEPQKGPEHTYLDARTLVSKSHPRIFLRGRIDTLIAETVLVQTSLNSGSRVPDAIRKGLADINAWLWQILQAEVSGEPMQEQGMCGMNAAVLREVALDPATYLNQGHIMPDPALGPCVALLNWLRARIREVEVAAVQVDLSRRDILQSLNSLSNAVYVLMLLAVVAESGREITKVGACGIS